MPLPKRSFARKVINRLGSNFYQINGMLRVLSWPEKMKYLLLYLRHIKSALRSDRLLSLDEQMIKSLKTLTTSVAGEKINLPIRKMEEIMDGLGNDTASLELIRELFGNNEYLRAFKKNIHRKVVFDIGSNRGYFVLLAHKILKCKQLICVEPQADLQSIRHVLAKANGIPLDSLVEYHKYCSSNDSPNSISINQIMKENAIEQIDFLKMDVEGGESDIFSANLEWLSHCKNITMEIHYDLADVGFIPSLLRSKGFKCLLTDLRGNPISEDNTRFLPRGCAYLYASSDGSLLP